MEAQDMVVADDDISSAHTQEPWVLDEAEMTIAASEGKRPICRVFSNGTGREHEDLANARLIAAAPKLLQRLKSVNEDLEGAKELMLLGGASDSWMFTEDGWDALIGGTERLVKEVEDS